MSWTYITLITGAIQRYFESRRRAWRESVSDNQERVKIQGKQRQKCARRERVSTNITKIIKYNFLLDV